MLISKSCDYALRALLFLARESGNQPIPLRQIAEVQKIPSSLLSKILHSLCAQGYLRSYRGIHGGYLLNKSADVITIGEIVEKIDGPPTVFSCVTFQNSCHLGGSCYLQTVFARAQEAMLEVLMGTTIAECVSNQTCLPDSISTTRV